jgi:hypothetical protein
VRCTLIVVFLALILAPCSAMPPRDALDVNDLVHRALANHAQREAVRVDYTYVARVRWTDFVSPGRSKPRITDTYEIIFLEDAPYARHLTRGGQPLPADQEKLEEALMQAEGRARCAETSGHSGLLPGSRPGGKLTWTLEHLNEEFNLRGKGMSVLNGRRVYVVEALPRENPTQPAAVNDYSRYFKTTLWIDVAEQQIVRLKEELVQDGLVITQPAFSFAYPLAPQNPQISESGTLRATHARGGLFTIQWTKLNDEIWLPQKSQSRGRSELAIERLDGEVTHYKNVRHEIETTYSDYKKFRVKTRIVP